jgi:hypothetical protein
MTDHVFRLTAIVARASAAVFFHEYTTFIVDEFGRETVVARHYFIYSTRAHVFDLKRQDNLVAALAAFETVAENEVNGGSLDLSNWARSQDLPTLLEATEVPGLLTPVTGHLEPTDASVGREP